MSSLWQRADETPFSLAIAIAYIAMAVLTDPFQPEPEALATYGWLTPLLVANGEWWRLLSHAFLHGGIVHLAFNTVMLLNVAPALERALGSARFLLLYALAALGGGIGVCLLYDIRQPIVGGSGALFGLLGSLLALNMRAGRHALAFLDFAGPRRLLSLIAMNLLIGFLIPFISNTAHIGGLLAGFFVTFLWLAPGRRPSPQQQRLRLAFAALFASLLGYCLWPAVRYDQLWNQSQQASPERSAALQRAAVMARYGIFAVSDRDLQRFRRDELEPAPVGAKRRR